MFALVREAVEKSDKDWYEIAEAMGVDHSELLTKVFTTGLTMIDAALLIEACGFTPECSLKPLPTKSQPNEWQLDPARIKGWSIFD